MELSDGDLLRVARAEHSRWYTRRRAAGWRPAAAGRADDDNALLNRHVHPWAALPAEVREGKSEDVRSQIAQLEAVGFMPVWPDDGPVGAATFRRTGDVRAQRITASQSWMRASGDVMSGASGDWHVRDDFGDERTVRDPEFVVTHEPLGGDRWRRIGTVRAWRVSDATVVRTLEGRAVAAPGDWIVQGPGGERWPVSDEQFSLGCRPTRPDGQ